MIRWILGLWWRWRAQPALPAPWPPADTEPNRIAVHEAGHAIAAWACTACREISIDCETPTGGQVRYKIRGDEEAIWCSLVILLAGLAAEIAVFKKAYTIPARKDLGQARTALDMLRACRVNRGVTLMLVPFHTFYVVPLDIYETEMMNAAYLMAQHLVSTPRYRRLVDLLLTKKQVTETEMEKVLGLRFPVVLLGKTGVSTFL